MEREVIPRAGGYPGGTSVRFRLLEGVRWVYLVPYVKGLVSEGKRVSQIFKRISPDVLLLHISPEELKGLKELLESGGEVEEMELSVADRVYMEVLMEYGDVKFPSPTLIAAMEYSLRHRTPVKGVDMREDEFTEVYLKHVNYFSRLKRDKSIKKALRKPFPAGRPEEAVMILDRAVMKQKGFREVERERVRRQVRGVFREARRWRVSAYLQEVERAEESLMELVKLVEKKGELMEVSTFPGKG